jgi:hypothetical protein
MEVTSIIAEEAGAETELVNDESDMIAVEPSVDNDIVIEDMAMDTIKNTYLIKTFELMKVSADGKKTILCFCGKPVVQRQNGLMQCGKYSDPAAKLVCGIRLDPSALTTYFYKQIKRKNNEVSSIVKLTNDKYIVEFPQCSICKASYLTMSKSKLPNMKSYFGKLMFTCTCPYTNTRRMSMEFSNFAKYFNVEIYDILFNKVNPNASANTTAKGSVPKKIKVDDGEEEKITMD